MRMGSNLDSYLTSNLGLSPVSSIHVTTLTSPSTEQATSLKLYTQRPLHLPYSAPPLADCTAIYPITNPGAAAPLPHPSLQDPCHCQGLNLSPSLPPFLAAGTGQALIIVRCDSFWHLPAGLPASSLSPVHFLDCPQNDMFKPYFEPWYPPVSHPSLLSQFLRGIVRLLSLAYKTLLDPAPPPHPLALPLTPPYKCKWTETHTRFQPASSPISHCAFRTSGCLNMLPSHR